jgi:hypothetical protein
MIDRRLSGGHLHAIMISPVILLHPDDNVLVCRADVAAGQLLRIDGSDVPARTAVGVGHKIARRNLAVGDRVSKYGALIGSMTASVVAGEHIHLHNMKSDYIATHTRDVASEGHA